MRITKRQLRRLIREACGLDTEEAPAEELALPPMPAPEVEPPAAAETSSSVPVPEDYQATRNFLDQNPDLTDMALQGIMQAVGAGCERSTAQAVVDHMQELLDGTDEGALGAEIDQGLMGLMNL